MEKQITASEKAELLRGHTFYFNTMGAAQRFMDRAEMVLIAVLGDDERIWVVTPATFSALIAAGYELAEA